MKFNIEDIYDNHRPGSSVGIETGYKLDGPGIESRWGGNIFRTCPDRPWGSPSLLCNGYRVFPGLKSGQIVTLTPHPLLVTWSRKSTAIPLFPLWNVRPVQSLSACTRVHFSFTFFYEILSIYPNWLTIGQKFRALNMEI